MLTYNGEKDSQLNAIITKEINVINTLQLSQENYKSYINLYIDEISATFENETFKTMLTTSLETALLQIGINARDLANLLNILDLIPNNPVLIQQNVDQYNKLFTKVDNNINIVNEILKKAINSYEQLSSLSNQPINEKLEEAKKVIFGIKEEEPVEPETPINIKEIAENDSSDFLCFFPKTDNDILAISTIQDTYKIMFNEEVATVCIKDDNFNFTLKTVGVQISNAENVFLVSRQSVGYFIITNMPMELPSYINVSRIDRNNNFIELGISNPTLSVSISKNVIAFSDELEKTSTPAEDVQATSIKPTEPIPTEQIKVKPEPIPVKPVEYIQPVQPVAPTQPAQPVQPVTPVQPVQVAASVNTVVQTPVTPMQPTQPVQTTPATPFGTIHQNPIMGAQNFVQQPTINPSYVAQPQEPIAPVQQVAQPQVPVNTTELRRESITNTTTADLPKDNDTLIISEGNNKIILPYRISEVEKQFSKSKKKYSSVNELIENEYILPAENFKNPIKSRFREAYQLIKKKEHGHLKEAIELGFEVMFNSKLNPAIIAACKNLKELDIYLDCLDDDELDKFSCFNIVYDVPPTSKK